MAYTNKLEYYVEVAPAFYRTWFLLKDRHGTVRRFTKRAHANTAARALIRRGLKVRVVHTNES